MTRLRSKGIAEVCCWASGFSSGIRHDYNDPGGEIARLELLCGYRVRFHKSGWARSQGFFHSGRGVQSSVSVKVMSGMIRKGFEITPGFSVLFLPWFCCTAQRGVGGGWAKLERENNRAGLWNPVKAGLRENRDMGKLWMLWRRKGAFERLFTVSQNREGDASPEKTAVRFQWSKGTVNRWEMLFTTELR